MKWATDPKRNKQLKARERKKRTRTKHTATTHIETKKNDDTKVDLWRLFVGRFRKFGFACFVYASNEMRNEQIYENDDNDNVEGKRKK